MTRLDGRGGELRLSPRTPKKVRTAAAVSVLVVILGAAGVLGWRLAREAEARRPPETPFDPGRLTAMSPVGDRVAVGRGEGDVLLYVTETCPFCRAELEAWSRVLESDPDGRPPLVILSPESDTQNLSYLPAVLRGSWVHDGDASIARSLRVRAVPYTAIMERGTVVRVHLGRSGEGDLARLAHRPSHPSPEGGQR